MNRQNVKKFENKNLIQAFPMKLPFSFAKTKNKEKC